MCEWSECPAAAPLTSQPHPATSEPLPSTSGTGRRAFNYLFSPPKLPIPPDSSITAQSDLNLVPSLSNQHAPKTELQAQDVDETRPPSKRGHLHFSSENSQVQLAKGLIPENTSKSTQWALATFEQWKEARNANCPEDPVPEDLLTCTDTTILNKNLSRFAVEAPKGNGREYPPSTIHQLLCGLLRHMRDTCSDCPNFLNKKDCRFKELHHTLDAHFHNLHATGVGRQVRHAEPFTKEDEAKLWASGALGINNPQSLQNAALFIVGKMFCLRGGEEHHALKISQITRMQDPDRYTYHETVSKNRNGSFKLLHVHNKVVPVFACPEAGVKCPVTILDKYFAKLPPQAFEKYIFYVRPLQQVPTDPNHPWYSGVPIGKHTLNDKVKSICRQAAITGHKTNHSLRATGVTQMFESGAPEKLIQERTGHRSLEGLRSYEKTNINQHEALSTLLTKSQSTSYAQQLFSSQQTSNIQWQSLSQPKLSFKNLHVCTININTSNIAANTSNNC